MYTDALTIVLYASRSVACLEAQSSHKAAVIAGVCTHVSAQFTTNKGLLCSKKVGQQFQVTR